MTIKLIADNPQTVPQELLTIVWDEVWNLVFRQHDPEKYLPRFDEYMEDQPDYHHKASEVELDFTFSSYTGLIAFTAARFYELFHFYLITEWEEIKALIANHGYFASLNKYLTVENLVQGHLPCIYTRGRLWAIENDGTFSGDDGDQRITDPTPAEILHAQTLLENGQSDCFVFKAANFYLGTKQNLSTDPYTPKECELITWAQKEPNRDDYLKLFRYLKKPLPTVHSSAPRTRGYSLPKTGIH